MKKLIISFAPTALLVTLIFLTIFVSGQQIYRQTSNDPQVQVSEDMAAIFTGDTEAESLVPTEKINPETSLGTFGIIYDTSGKPLASSGELGGETPELPVGVIDKARTENQHKITWEPKDDVRIAAVVTKAEKGYVLVGRSLREAEKRIRNLGFIILGAHLTTLVLFFALAVASQRKATNKA